MPRPRDTQRSRVYRAEDCLPDCRTNMFGTTAGAQAWLDTRVLAQRWFRARWRLPGGVRVLPGRNGASSDNHGNIRLGRQTRNPAVVLHELTHQILDRDLPTGVGKNVAAHGPEFAAVLLYLVGQVMGRESAEKLRAAYAEYGVKHRTGAKALPGVRYRVTTQAAAIRRNRQAQATKPLPPGSRTLAAAIIRRAVRAGEFGKAGSKPRAHALATARTLERGQT